MIVTHVHTGLLFQEILIYSALIQQLKKDLVNLIKGIMTRKKPTIKLGQEILLEISDAGFNNNWADWPINFDPAWITCNLPITSDDCNALIERHPELKK